LAVVCRAASTLPPRTTLKMTSQVQSFLCVSTSSTAAVTTASQLHLHSRSRARPHAYAQERTYTQMHTPSCIRTLQVTDAIHLSRSTLNKIRQNLFWALGYNLVGGGCVCACVKEQQGARAGLCSGACLTLLQCTTYICITLSCV